MENEGGGLPARGEKGRRKLLRGVCLLSTFCLKASATPAPHRPLALHASVTKKINKLVGKKERERGFSRQGGGGEGVYG
jgi:hypothetical protein